MIYKLIWQLKGATEQRCCARPQISFPPGMFHMLLDRIVIIHKHFSERFPLQLSLLAPAVLCSRTSSKFLRNKTPGTRR
jgi:hypothetical protein